MQSLGEMHEDCLHIWQQLLWSTCMACRSLTSRTGRLCSAHTCTACKGRLSGRLPAWPDMDHFMESGYPPVAAWLC